MVFNSRQKAVIKLFEWSELWHSMGFESVDEAMEEMSYEEIEALMEHESHNLDQEINEVLNEQELSIN